MVMAEGPKIYKEINELYSEILDYRKKGKLEELLKFCARLQTIGAYNAMLVHAQLPGAALVLTRQRWEKDLHRRIKPSARPLIVLMPFSPVEFVFDVCDTELIPGAPDRAEAKLEELMHPFPVLGKVSLGMLHCLEDNLRYFGIFFSDDYKAGPMECAKIQRYDKKVNYDVLRWDTFFSIPFPLEFQLCVDHAKPAEEQFVSICHELGHYFCGHLKPNSKRDKVQEEFEAEIVAWMVASRIGLQDSGAVPFLSQYAEDDNDELPKVNIGTVLSAADQIEKMFSTIDIKNSWLYKHKESFKESVDKILVRPSR